MKAPALLAALLLLGACAQRPAPAAAPRQIRYAGWVSDAACGAEHVGGKNPGCVKKCLRGGAHVGHPEWAAQAMVLVLDDSEKVVVVRNPEALAGHEAQHVVVDAVAENDGLRVIRVVP